MENTALDELRTLDRVLYRNLRKPLPLIEGGEGIYLYDREGNRYLDLCAGVAVVNIGYGVPEVIEAMMEQAHKACFIYPSVFTSEPLIRLSKRIVDLAPENMSSVLFVSGGSEAVEAAIKFARQYHLAHGRESKQRVIGRWTSYHGNTIGALSAGGRIGWRGDFIPYLLNFPHIHAPYCYRCPWGRAYPDCGVACAHELERAIRYEGPDTISAFIAEPIIGTSAAGVTPPPEYYPIIREICDRYDVLFICDEVINGFGRTGANFGIDHWRVEPDIIATGKGLGGGYNPLAAVIVSEEIYDAFLNGTGLHTQGHTYSGNPLSAAVGLAVLDYLEEHGIIERVAKMEQYLRDRLEGLRDLGIVGDVRGKGLLFGVEFVQDVEEKTPFPSEVALSSRIVQAAIERRLRVMSGTPGLVDGVLGDHLQITPPLTITEVEIDLAIDLLRDAIQQAMQEVGI